jgi:hypothetical protein
MPAIILLVSAPALDSLSSSLHDSGSSPVVRAQYASRHVSPRTLAIFGIALTSSDVAATTGEEEIPRQRQDPVRITMRNRDGGEFSSR